MLEKGRIIKTMASERGSLFSAAAAAFSSRLSGPPLPLAAAARRLGGLR